MSVNGVPGLMVPFAHTRLTGREVVALAEQEVRKQGINLSEYPGFLAPNTLYPDITVRQVRDGRMQWFVRWSRRIDDTRGENLPVWIDDQSRVAHVNYAPGGWKEMPDTDYAGTVLFRVEQESSVVIPASIPSPAYPYDLARAGIGGGVEVAFVIKPDGGIADTKLVKSSQREFEGPVNEVIKPHRAGSECNRAGNRRSRCSRRYTMLRSASCAGSRSECARGWWHTGRDRAACRRSAPAMHRWDTAPAAFPQARGRAWCVSTDHAGRRCRAP